MPNPKYIEATFLERINRYKGKVKIDRFIKEVFIPNPGRLQELLLPGKKVIITPSYFNSKRKTNYDLVAVYHNDTVVSIDSRLPNSFFECNWRRFNLFFKYTNYKKEYSYRNSRIDFLLYNNAGEKCLVEVKSCTLVKKGGIASFPDAPTKRGEKHLHTLIDSIKDGYEAVVFFVIQRDDAIKFKPNEETDTAFGHTYYQAIAHGVKIYALTTEWNNGELKTKRFIPIDIGGETYKYLPPLSPISKTKRGQSP